VAEDRETSESVEIEEVRVLDGPNLYFTRPAVKVTLAVPGWLDATELRVEAAARAAGFSSSTAAQPGGPRSEQRRRFVVRLAAHLTRGLAAAAGTRLAVRSRPGPEQDSIVIAYPWRRKNGAEALGRELGWLMGKTLGAPRSMDGLYREAIGRIGAIDPGPPPSVPEPDIPVVAVTGTNGKTTTVRLLAFMARTAGKTVAYSSTDGVYRQGRLIEEGDYSGFGGAGKALSQPGVDTAILETARGGILLRGIGTMHNDAAVVTNVSADHLGLLGIRSLDQLAEVKSTITKITRPEGWDVLNADDPRVLAMRRGISGRPWLFSMDQDHPALRGVLSEGGRGITIVDGHLSVLLPGRSPRQLVPLEEVPVTLAGISRHNIQNAMAATAAALAIGLPEEAVVQALRTFILDPETNPGRANLFEVNRVIVVADYAHNEAGIQGLVEVCRALRRPGAEFWMAFTTAGDRSDEILHGMGYLAGRGADHVVIAELLGFLRGRDRDDLIRRLVAGAEDGGAKDVPVFIDEAHALMWMLEHAKPYDLVAVTPLVQRPEIFALLKDRMAKRIGPKRLRQLVRSAAPASAR
jgi:cyanophycin synthetase